MSTIRIGRDDFDATRHDTDPFLLRHPGLGDLSRRAHSRPIPPIPDLRFEYTYLKNIRSHVRVERIEESATTDEKGVAGDEQVASLSKEVVHVEWGSVMWVTFKEQFVSPLVQGVLWGVIRWYFLPGAVELGQSLKQWWKRGDTLSARPRGGRQSIDGVRQWVFGKH